MRVAIVCTVLIGCIVCSGCTSTTEIRIENVSKRDFTEVSIAGQSYGHIAAGTASDYKPVRLLGTYAAMKMKVDGKYVTGQTLNLGSSKFTYRIGVKDFDKGHLDIKVVRDRNTSTQLGSFEISMPSGWRHSSSYSGQGETTRVFRSGGKGTLRLRSLPGLPMVSKEILRNLTNVDSSILLDWQSWGDLSGYHYEYIESGTLYRQWWLTNQQMLLFIVYSSESQDYSEVEVTNRMVNSVRAIH